MRFKAFLLFMLVNCANAMSISDAVLKGMDAANTTVHQQGSYYGGKDFSGRGIA